MSAPTSPTAAVRVTGTPPRVDALLSAGAPCWPACRSEKAGTTLVATPASRNKPAIPDTRNRDFRCRERPDRSGAAEPASSSLLRRVDTGWHFMRHSNGSSRVVESHDLWLTAIRVADHDGIERTGLEFAMVTRSGVDDAHRAPRIRHVRTYSLQVGAECGLAVRRGQSP